MTKFTLRSLCIGLLVCCFTTQVQCQERWKPTEEFTFYGIDYAQVRVFGAKESATKFVNAFTTINQLLLAERHKYRFRHRTAKKRKEITLRAVHERNSAIDPEELMLWETNGYMLSQEQLAEEVKILPVKEKEGIGLVVIAELLNKRRRCAHYHAVYFDIKTREIINARLLSGKARGFGVRNYWAHSVLKVLRKI